MASRGHTIRPIEPHRSSEPCVSCRGPWAERTAATWVVTYRYVTGRAGRTSFAERRVCDAHAAKFRARWHPAELDVGGGERHALDQVLGTALTYQGGCELFACIFVKDGSS